MDTEARTGLGSMALAQLARDWERENWSHFARRMQRPAFALVESTTLLGRYLHDVRRMEFARALVFERPWGEVVEVLKHEMAHQYVAEVLHAEEGPHGPAFRDVCAKLGIDARASGTPAQAARAAGPRVLDRIRKLLSLASSGNQHEAEAAMRAARKLMLEHNLAERDADRARGYVHAQLGRVSGRKQFWEHLLGRVVMEHFFVSGIYVPSYRAADGIEGSILEVMGTETNVEMARYVYDFLAQAAERSWQEHKRAARLRGDKDRLAYLAGVMRGFLDRLEDERKKCAGEGLVWVSDPSLDRFFAQRHPRVRNVSRASAAGSDGFDSGREAGRSLVLHRPMTSGPSGHPPRRLTSG